MLASVPLTLTLSSSLSLLQPWAQAAADPIAAPAPSPATTSPAGPKRVPPPSHPAPARWGLDAAITVAAGVPYALLAFGVSNRQTPAPLGPPPDVGPIDKAAVGHFSPPAATASDVLVATSIAAPFVLHAVEAGLDVRRYGGGGRRWGGRFGTDALLLAETLAISGLMTEVIKSAVDRPRPLAHLDPAEIDPAYREELIAEQQEADRARSFPSGHSTMAFAAATAGSTLLTLKPLGRRRRLALGLTWSLTMSAAVTTAVLRVVAGKHFVSDVIAGAALGGGIGAAVPLAHYYAHGPGPARRSERVAIRPWRARHAAGVAIAGTLP